MAQYEDFYTEEEQQQILAAIRKVETETSGEVRVHLEDHCHHYPRDRAAFVFEQLKMHKTRERNGVLFYLSVCDHNFAVLGDVGIHQKVGDSYWKEICDRIEADFRNGAFKEGLVKAITKVGVELKAYFPSRGDDSNELDDAISTGPIG